MSVSLKLTPADFPGFSRIFLPESTASTNTDGRGLLEDADALARRSLGLFSVVATGDQRQGRGRLDRQWTAPAGTSLSVSFLVRPHADPAVRLPLESFHWATLLVALAAVQTLDEIAGVKASLKWPNDVLVGEKKICGILANLVAEPDGKYSLVVGIGTNVNLSATDAPVPTATSLFLEKGQKFELEQVLRILASRFEKLVREFFGVAGQPDKPLGNGLSLLENLRHHMSTLGQSVKVHLPGGKVEQGVAVDINEEGEILVRLQDGAVQAYAVGDIVHLRNK